MSPRSEQPRRLRAATAACAVGGTMLVRLGGAAEPESAAETAFRAEQCAQAARALGQSLILDLSDTTVMSEADVAALEAAVRQADRAPAAVVAPDPRLRKLLKRRLGPRVGLHPSVSEALAELARAQPGGPAEPAAPARSAASETVPEQAAAPVSRLRQEIYGLRARARSYGLIDYAQGVLAARYRLADPEQAFMLLREASQRHNVPLRVFASAMAGAPAPPEEGPWFPRRLRLPVPSGPFRTRRRAHPTDRAAVLLAAVDEAIELTAADAGTVHLADLARRSVLVLEAHRNHGSAYLDAYARLTRPATAAARAWAQGRATSAVEDPPTPDPEDESPLGQGPHAAHATPLAPPTGPRQGALTVQHRDADHRLTPDQRTAQLKLAKDLAAWLSWYRRTVILDALEHLHDRATALQNRS
ncbi:ANTAR domain-containing protein [Phaeacidiphilus oryzae]|uniref:ANTAR domain-containing protein n=1 Tax=Phaeacidiphilus oryzae TaxID=348818 RepID=UPI000690D85E|nr:ANTAR domain-containing protein [Phaeacidiphilus oryzae]